MFDGLWWYTLILGSNYCIASINKRHKSVLCSMIKSHDSGFNQIYFNNLNSKINNLAGKGTQPLVNNVSSGLNGKQISTLNFVNPLYQPLPLLVNVIACSRSTHAMHRWATGYFLSLYNWNMDVEPWMSITYWVQQNFNYNKHTRKNLEFCLGYEINKKHVQFERWGSLPGL